MMARVLPDRLCEGDCVAVVSPGGAPDPDALEAGVEVLRGRGLKVQVGPHALDRYGYLAGADRDRAADMMQAFLDPGVKAIFCARGGVGCARMLPYLDLPAIAARPKVFVGYSDVTILHLAIERAGGWPTFYGPMVATELGPGLCPECIELLWRLISRAEPAGSVACPGVAAQHRCLVPGAAEGVLTGGTLCLLDSSIGTAYAMDAAGKILVLEDSHETPWRVDRMLTHLAHAGALDGVAGFAIGSLVSIVDEPEEPSLSVEQSLLDHLQALGRPVLYGVPFGHIDAPLTLPLGCRARLDAVAGTIEVLEPAVQDV